MKKISAKVHTVLQSEEFRPYFVHEVAIADGPIVHSYDKLVDLVAKIGYYNPEYTLLFRGQHKDHRELTKHGEESALFPSLWRLGPKERPDAWEQMQEWCKLLDRLTTLTRVERRRLRAIPETPWAILQHYYDVTKCRTPLLDVTESLRVAASVATQGYLGANNNENCHGVVFVFGFPAINQGITISVDDGLILLRLSSACPQPARRPHFQRGFLAGTYPTDKISGGKEYKNFAVRLIGKLRISTDSCFWDVDCPLQEEALFPKNDKLRDELAGLAKYSIHSNAQ